MKKRFNKALLLLVPSLLLTGCNLAGPSDYTFEDYGYSNQDPIPGKTYDFTNEDDMKVDGIYDEKYGESVYRLYNKNVVGSPVYTDMYVYYGENGVHIYTYTKENIINYVKQKAVYYNTSIELFLNNINNTYISFNSLQYRIAAGGRYTKLRGSKSRSAWCTNEFDADFATHVDGEFNTTDAEGFGIETFTPYYELGFASKEECKGLMIMLAYNRVPSTSLDQKSTFRQRTAKMLAFQATPVTWVPVVKGENGQGENATPKSSYYGDANGIQTSYGFKFEGSGESEKGYETIESSAGYTMVKEGYDHTNYFYETKIKSTTTEGLSTKKPKVGLFTYMNQNRFTLYLKPQDTTRVGIVQRNATNSDWNWTVGEEQTYVNDWNDAAKGNPDHLDFNKNGALLGLYRKGNTFGFFVNGELYFATGEIELHGVTYSPMKEIKIHHSESIIEGIYDDAYVGIYSYTSKCEFSGTKILSSEEADEYAYSLLNK